MAVTIITDFFNMIDVSLFDTVSAIFVICFIVWEIPRSVKVMDEEYTKGLYPENGRVADFGLLFIGLLSIFYFIMDNNARLIVDFLKTTGLTTLVLILMIAIPLIVILGYFKRLFARVDSHDSVTVFLTHAFLDLMHTLFHITLVVLFVPVLGHLLFGG